MRGFLLRVILAVLCSVVFVTTIGRVTERLGESVGFLYDIANEIEIEEGVIWIYGVGDCQIMAFTDFGVENLVQLNRDPQGAEIAAPEP